MLSLSLILLVLALIFAVLAFFIPNKRLSEVAVVLMAIALLIGHVK